MKYISEFADIKKKLYKVEIQTDSGSGTKNFILSGTPFVTTMKSEDKHLYSPIKTTGATVTMLTDDLPFNVYSGKAQGTKVTLTSENKVLWVGYATPCMYDMGFDEHLEELEIECVDGIAVLKEIPYNDSTHNVATFAQIIHKCLKQSGCYTNFYISDNVQLTRNGSESVIDKFRISQQNFFDEKEDIAQTDDDVAWSCYDVLFEICQFLGYTLFADGDEVFIIDYDAIRKGNNKYFKYSLSGSTVGTPSTVTLSYSKHIDGDSYSENGAKVSLDEVYNKVTVMDDFYTFENLFPDFGDINFETNITASSDQALKNFCISDSGHYVLADTFQEVNKNGVAENYQIMISKSWRNRMWIIVAKFYDSPVFQFEKYSYQSAARTRVTDEAKWNNMSWSKMFDAHGAYYARIFKREISGGDYNSWRVNYPSNWDSMTADQKKQAWVTLLNKNPQQISMTPMVICLNHDTNHIGPGGLARTGKYTPTDTEDCRLYPFIRLKGDRNSSIFGGEGSYLIIQGTFRYHDERNTPYPLADGGDNGKLKRKDDLKYADQGFVWARLKWGDMYWNGESWTTTPADFKIRFWDLEKSRDDRKNKSHYDKDFEIVDTAQAKFGCSEKGYYIPAPTNGNLQGTADFIIYANRDMWGDSRRSHWHADNRYSRYYSKCVFFKDLNIKAYISNGILDDQASDTDTAYTNVIDNGSVSEMDEIKFKICTFDNKKPTYSSVDYLQNGKSVYLTSTYNKALASELGSSVGCDKTHQALRQEEQLIFKLARQYEEPKVILECNLHNEGYKLYGTYTDKTLSGKTFVISELTTDYKMNQQNIKFTEKA